MTSTTSRPTPPFRLNAPLPGLGPPRPLPPALPRPGPASLVSSPREFRKPRTQVLLTARSSDAVELGNSTATRIFFAPSATPPTLDFLGFLSERRCEVSQPASALHTSGRCLVLFSKLGDGTASVPLWAFALASLSEARYCDFAIPFSPTVSRGHGRLAKAPAPWRYGALLRGPPGFRPPPKKISRNTPGPNANLFWSLHKKQSLTWGAGATCCQGAPRESEAEKEIQKNVPKSHSVDRLRR